MIEILYKTGEDGKRAKSITMNVAADYKHVLLQLNDYEDGDQVRISLTPAEVDLLKTELNHYLSKLKLDHESNT